MKNKGITLISLVVTIIILIIIASVTTYTGVSTIKSSKFTKFRSELEIMQAQVDYLYDKYKDDLTQVTTIGKDLTGSTKENNAFEGAGETDKSGYRFFDKSTLEELEVSGIESEYLVNIERRKVIDLDGFSYELQKYYTLEQVKGETAEVGGLERGGIDFSVRLITKNSEGGTIAIEGISFSKYVGKGTIKYKEEESEIWKTIDSNAKEKDYNFTIKEDGKYIIRITDAAGNTADRKIDIIGQAYNAKRPQLHIPTGFYYKTGTVDKGYVITDDAGNEFVWIPVEHSSDYVKKLGTNNWYLTDSGVGSTLNENIRGDIIGLTNILGKSVTGTLSATPPEAEIVNAAGGFWVGRYEAGVNVTGEIDWSTNPTIVVKQGVQPARKISQEDALSKANNWKSGNADATKGTVAFQSGLITGTQWDAMCNFIGWSITNAKATTWGNYSDVRSSTYTGYHSPHSSYSWVYESGVTKLSNNTTQWIFPTGSFVTEYGTTTAKKNIYDIAGNVWDWTTEVPMRNGGNNRVYRGGAVWNDTSFIVAGRAGDVSYNYPHWGLGFRIVLYVK